MQAYLLYSGDVMLLDNAPPCAVYHLACSSSVPRIGYLSPLRNVTVLQVRTSHVILACPFFFHVLGLVGPCLHHWLHQLWLSIFVTYGLTALPPLALQPTKTWRCLPRQAAICACTVQKEPDVSYLMIWYLWPFLQHGNVSAPVGHVAIAFMYLLGGSPLIAELGIKGDAAMQTAKVGFPPSSDSWFAAA